MIDDDEDEIRWGDEGPINEKLMSFNEFCKSIDPKFELSLGELTDLYYKYKLKNRVTS